MQINPDLRKLPRDVIDAVRAAGGRPYVVGGFVRDAIVGVASEDVDIEVYDLELSDLIDLLERSGLRVDAVGRAFGVLKVSRPGEDAIDLSLPRRENRVGSGHKGFVVEHDGVLSIEDAAARRDFTINAMLWDPLKKDVIDPFGGVADQAAGILRRVGPAFSEDPLRVLRGMQFCGRFDLAADAGTLRAARAMREEYDTLPVERVWAEWMKWASRSRVPSAGLHFLRQSAWLERYPELVALIACPQDPEWHPEGEVWTHTLHCCDAAARIAERDELGAEERGVLVLAALCHDLGKPETTVRAEDGRIRSAGHAEATHLTESFLARIGCPKAIVNRCVALMRRHLAHIGFGGSARAVRRLARFLGQAGETIEMLVRLIEADHDARPPLSGGLPADAKRLLEVAEEVQLKDSVPQEILRGRHLISRGVEPGPAMGVILAEAYEAQLDGVFGDLEGALDWLESRLGPGPVSS